MTRNITTENLAVVNTWSAEAAIEIIAMLLTQPQNNFPGIDVGHPSSTRFTYLGEAWKYLDAIEDFMN